MSLLAASPLLSSLFLTYANRAAALDGPPTPTPIDREWSEMKALNTRLQEEISSLRAQLEKETDRAKVAEDCVEALRTQVSSFKDANYNLETEVSNERAKLGAITLEYAEHKKEAADTIAVLRDTVDKEAVSRSSPLIGSNMSHLSLGCTSCPQPSHRGPTNFTCTIEGEGRMSSPPQDSPPAVPALLGLRLLGASELLDEHETPRGGQARKVSRWREDN